MRTSGFIQVIRSGQEVHIKLPAECWPHLSEQALRAGPASVWSLPLKSRDRTTGALNLYCNGNGHWDGPAATVARDLAAQAAVVLANAASLGGNGPRGVVDLSLARFLATEARAPEDLAQAPRPGRPGDRDGPGLGLGTRARPAQGGNRGFETRWQSGPDGDDQLSARLMCSDDGIALVSVAGEVDYCTAPVLGMAVNEALRVRASEVFVDLAQVSFFGAAGASALAAARRRCQRHDAGFAILRPSRAALRVLSFTDLVNSQTSGQVIDLRDRPVK
jgi:anti-anti-sigma factor